MIERERIGPVEKFRLAHGLLGRGFYFTAAYRVGELMVDSGCAHTARELAELRKLVPRLGITPQ